MKKKRFDYLIFTCFKIRPNQMIRMVEEFRHQCLSCSMIPIIILSCPKNANTVPELGSTKSSVYRSTSHTSSQQQEPRGLSNYKKQDEISY